MDMTQLLVYVSGACFSAVPTRPTHVRKVSQEKTKPGTGFEQINLWIILGALSSTKNQDLKPPAKHHLNPIVFPGIEFRGRDEGVPDHTRDLMK